MSPYSFFFAAVLAVLVTAAYFSHLRERAVDEMIARKLRRALRTNDLPDHESSEMRELVGGSWSYIEMEMSESGIIDDYHTGWLYIWWPTGADSCFKAQGQVDTNKPLNVIARSLWLKRDRARLDERSLNLMLAATPVLGLLLISLFINPRL